MRYWRALLWIVPISTLIPLADFAYLVATLNFSAYFSDVKFAGLLVLVGIPNLVILAASVGGAVQARKRPLVALIAVSAIWAWQLSPLAWSGLLWDSHTRPYLLLTTIPGTIAGGLAVSGLVMLRRTSKAIAISAAILLLVPVVSTGGGLVNFAVVAARDCPAGPPVDLTFSGLENAHFTTSCGIPTGVSTLAGCHFGEADITLPLNFAEWDLQFRYSDTVVTSGGTPNYGPYLIVGGNTTYGGTSGGISPTWNGTYAFDAGSECSGSVKADLYPPTGPGAGSVHVSGHFAAPQP